MSRSSSEITDHWQLKQWSFLITINCRKESALSNKSALLQPKDAKASRGAEAQTSRSANAHTTRSPEAFSRLSCSKSSSKAKEVTQSRSSSSGVNSINKSEASLAPPLQKKRRESKRKSSGMISSPEPKTGEMKSIESRPKVMKSEVEKSGSERKKREDMERRKKEKEKDREKLKSYQKKKILENHIKKENIKDVKKKKRVEHQMIKSEEKNRKDTNVLHTNAHAERKELPLESEKVVGTSGEHEQKLETSKFNSDKVFDFYSINPLRHDKTFDTFKANRGNKNEMPTPRFELKIYRFYDSFRFWIV